MRKEQAIRIALVVLLTFVIISLSYHVLAFRPGIYPLEDQRNVRNFLIGFEELTTEMTPAEVSHLHDVKSVMLGVAISSILALLITAGLTYTLKKKEVLHIYKKAGYATIITVIALVITGLGSFGFLFSVFHGIFFPQGNYIFSSSSTLITLFPQSFFVARFAEVLVLSVVLASIFIGVIVYLEKKK